MTRDILLAKRGGKSRFWWKKFQRQKQLNPSNRAMGTETGRLRQTGLMTLATTYLPATNNGRRRSRADGKSQGSHLSVFPTTFDKKSPIQSSEHPVAPDPFRKPLELQQQHWESSEISNPGILTSPRTDGITHQTRKKNKTWKRLRNSSEFTDESGGKAEFEFRLPLQIASELNSQSLAGTRYCVQCSPISESAQVRFLAD